MTRIIYKFPFFPATLIVFIVAVVETCNFVADFKWISVQQSAVGGARVQITTKFLFRFAIFLNVER